MLSEWTVCERGTISTEECVWKDGYRTSTIRQKLEKCEFRERFLRHCNESSQLSVRNTPEFDVVHAMVMLELSQRCCPYGVLAILGDDDLGPHVGQYEWGKQMVSG